MDLTKTKTEQPEIVATKIRHFDEDTASSPNDTNGIKDTKKTNPLEPEFVGPKVEEPPNVGFFKLFRFATCQDKTMMFIGLLGVLVTGACIPLQTQVFGSITNTMVGYGFERENIWESLTPEQREERNEKFLDDVWSFGINYSLIGIVTFLCSYAAVTLFNYSAVRQAYVMRGIFFKKTLNQDMSWFDLRDSGQFASRMSEDIQKIEDGMGEKIPMFIHQQVAFIGCYILAFIRGWELALVCMISLPITSITMFSVMRIIRKYAVRELDEYGKAGSIAEEVLSAIRTVIAFGGAEKESVRYSERLVYAKNNNIKRTMFMGIGFGCLWFFIYCTYALAFWDGVRLLLRDKGNPDGVYDTGTMVTVFFSVLMGNMNFGMATPYIENFAGACGAAKTVFSVIDTVPKIDAMSDEGEKPTNIQGSITFKDVHFEYPSRSNVKILQGLNLTINRGETVALVGSSGCGKSTCIQLIQRLYDPRTGTVLLDNRDISKLNVTWLRSQIGVVGQEPVLFGCSIAENIRFGNPKASQQDIENAAKKANAHDFIMSLPNKYETKVGERGTQMSGGQKQRIAIARALVRDPSILLLDEATSALDTNSEAKVQKALDSASKGRTTIIVAHRLSTIKGADKIVVISKGQVVEQGTHSELMAVKGDYYNLVTAQISVNDPEDEDTFDDDSVIPGNFNSKKMAQRQMSKISALSSGSLESQGSQPEPPVTDLDDFEDDPEPLSIIDVLKLNAPEWYIIIIACIGSIIMGTSMPLFSVIFGDILGGLSGDDEEEIRKSTNNNAILFVGLGAIVGVSTFLQQYMFGIAGEKLTMRLRGQLFSAMLKQEIGYFDDPKQGTGTLCARLSTEASAVQGATGSRIGTILQSCSTVVFGVGLAVYYEWRIGLATLAFSPFILLATYLERSQMMSQNKKNKGDIEQAAKLAVEVVSNIRTVVSLGREKTFYEEYITLLLPSFMKQKRSVHFRGIVFGLGRSLMFFAYATAMVYGAYLIVNDDLGYDRVFKVSQALIMGTTSIAQAFAFAPNFQKGLQAAGNIISLLNRKPKVFSAPGTKPENWTCQGDIEYKAIQFKYPSRPDSLVLRKLDLSIQKGETVALVGPSGCGKSTVIQLLERFYDPNSGSITLDNKSIHNDVHLDTLRSQLGIVSQEPTLFDRTIEQNIAYGDNSRQVSKQEVMEAAKNANIHTFITSLPLGYDTKIGDKGTQLSGGQKQRVAIARALVRNPKILLLDEATSALDTESEHIVQDALDKARKGRTCITIAHRLSTIQDADTIFVINKGKVVEIGTHQSLMALKGVYYKLQTLSSKKLS